jgi:hypothetical protein
MMELHAVNCQWVPNCIQTLRRSSIFAGETFARLLKPTSRILMDSLLGKEAVTFARLLKPTSRILMDSLLGKEAVRHASS